MRLGPYGNMAMTEPVEHMKANMNVTARVHKHRAKRREAQCRRVEGRLAIGLIQQRREQPTQKIMPTGTCVERRGQPTDEAETANTL